MANLRRLICDTASCIIYVPVRDEVSFRVIVVFIYIDVKMYVNVYLGLERRRSNTCRNLTSVNIQPLLRLRNTGGGANYTAMLFEVKHLTHSKLILAW